MIGPLTARGRASANQPWRLVAIVMAVASALSITPAFALDTQKSITQFRHQSWGAEKGISTVFSITQTKDGYIWIAALNGIFQFDGVNFTRLEKAPGEPPDSTGFFSILGTKDGSLWISRRECLLRLKNGQTTIYGEKDGFPGGSSPICEDDDGVIWVATKDGLARFSHEKWQAMTSENGLPSGSVRTLIVDRAGTLWVVLETPYPKPSYLVAFLRRGERHFHSLSGGENLINRLAEAPDRTMWAALPSRSVRPFRYDQSELQFASPEIQVGSQFIIFDRDGTLWIPTLGDGLRRVRNTAALGSENIAQHSDAVDKYTQRDGLSSDVGYTAFEDREGNIWIGTVAGLDCFSETKVTSLTTREGLPFDQNLVLQATPEGSIWAGTAPRGFEEISNGETQFVDWKWFGLKPSGIPYSNVHSIYLDPAGDLFLGTGWGVITIPKGSGKADYLPGAARLLGVNAMTRDQTGTLWLGNNVGTYYLKGDQVEDVPEIRSHGTAFAVAMHTDAAGRVWIGCNTGMVACNDGGHFKWYSAKDGLFSGPVLGIFSDAKNQIWIYGKGGISRFSESRFQTLTRSNGLPDDDVFAALQDDRGFFWLGGWSGLFRVATSDLERGLSSPQCQVRGELLDLKDGLRGPVHGNFYIFGRAGSTKSLDGRLWFATGTGLAIVDPRHIATNEVPPSVCIQKIIAAGQARTDFRSLKYRPGTKDCEIQYVGLSFVNPARVRYKYQLEGYDRTWVEAGTRRSAYYSNLRSGNYRFRVIACNNDGVWNEAGDAISFSIAPAFYERAWFPFLCALPLALGLWGVHRFRLARLSARLNLELEAQKRERKRLAQELHDTLLQGFTGMGLKLEAIATRLPDSLDATRDNLRDILNDSDQYLAEARRAVWELRSSALTETGDFAAALSKACAQLVKGTGIEVHFSATGRPRRLLPIVEDNVVRIAQEATTNAVKHARPKRVTVHLAVDDDHVRLRIHDDGCGFDVDGADAIKSGHFGLAGLRERAEALGGTLKLRSRSGAGTEVVATIPLSRRINAATLPLSPSTSSEGLSKWNRWFTFWRKI